LPAEIWKTHGTVCGRKPQNPFFLHLCSSFISFLFKPLVYFPLFWWRGKKLTIPFFFSFREKLENVGSAFKRWKQERRDSKTTRRSKIKTYFGTLL